MKKIDKPSNDAGHGEPVEEYIEMESATGRYRREAIQSAQSSAEAEALANNRRDLRVASGLFVARYTPGKESKRFTLFGSTKKCVVIDASIRGLGIEAKKGLNKGDKITLLISDGAKGEVPEFEIIATVMYTGPLDKKQARYGLQYDHSPSSAYSMLLNSETLKRKMEKAQQQDAD